MSWSTTRVTGLRVAICLVFIVSLAITPGRARAVSDAPVAVDNLITVPASYGIHNGDVELFAAIQLPDLLANDLNADQATNPVTFAIWSDPRFGTWDQGGCPPTCDAYSSQLVYNGNPGEDRRTDTFDYAITDAMGRFSIATVVIVWDHTPTLATDTDYQSSGDPVTILPLENDTYLFDRPFKALTVSDPILGITLGTVGCPDADNPYVTVAPDGSQQRGGFSENYHVTDADGTEATSALGFLYTDNTAQDPTFDQICIHDYDRDGLTDEAEEARPTDPNVMDSDNDGVSDFAESLLGTDPQDPDTDHDCQPDTVDSIDLTGPAVLDCAASSSEIVIRMHTSPSEDSSGFRVSIGSTYEGFLHDGDVAHVPVPPGTYTIAEAPTIGWRVSDITCSSEVAVDLLDARATVAVGDGEVAACDFTNRQDPWAPLVALAAQQYQVDLDSGDGVARGFYNQILDIVCASARSASATCDSMSPSYASDQWAGFGWDCTADKADCWIFNVFNAYLKEDPRYPDPETEVLAIEADTESALEAYCLDALAAGAALTDPLLGLAGKPLCKYLSHNSYDYAALYAGSIHFMTQLEPNFRQMTEAVVQSDLLAASPITALYVDLQTIRAEHAKFIDLAVLPGFDEVYAGGNLSVLAKTIAQTTVPFAAQCFREGSIQFALAGAFGKKQGANIYEAVTPAATEDLVGSRRCKTLLKAAQLAM